MFWDRLLVIFFEAVRWAFPSRALRNLCLYRILRKLVCLYKCEFLMWVLEIDVMSVLNRSKYTANMSGYEYHFKELYFRWFCVRYTQMFTFLVFIKSKERKKYVFIYVSTKLFISLMLDSDVWQNRMTVYHLITAGY